MVPGGPSLAAWALGLVAALRVEDKSPWPSEMAALLALGRDFGVTAWIDSGTYLGYSAAALALSGCSVVTVERDPALARRACDGLARRGLAVSDWISGAWERRVTVLTGLGEDLVPDLCRDATAAGRRVGVFLDGPKGLPAAELAQRLWEDDRLDLPLVAVHDCYLSVPGRPNPARGALEELGCYSVETEFWASDDAEWVADVTAAGVDRFDPATRHSWRPGVYAVPGRVPLAMRSYGPTVGCLLRETR